MSYSRGDIVIVSDGTIDRRYGDLILAAIDLIGREQ